jgi:hypothetical protein
MTFIELSSHAGAHLASRSRQMAINLKALDDALQKMSGVVLSLLWTFKALSDSAEWVAVRNIAQDAANELDLRGRTSDL